MFWFIFWLQNGNILLSELAWKWEHLVFELTVYFVELASEVRLVLKEVFQVTVLRYHHIEIFYQLEVIVSEGSVLDYFGLFSVDVANILQHRFVLWVVNLQSNLSTREQAKLHSLLKEANSPFFESDLSASLILNHLHSNFLPTHSIIFRFLSCYN